VANHKDAIKRYKQSENRRVRNRAIRTAMRNQIKVVRAAIEGGDAPVAKEALNTLTSVLHRTVSKGVIHRNQAARKISRMNAAVKALG
jgi:small subunit ribosomal protein S20